MKEAFFMEKATVKVITGAVDLNTGANTGARVDMLKFKRVTFIVAVEAGTTPSAHTHTLKQHTVATSGTPADLSVDNPYFHKVNTATEFTKVQPGSAAAAYDVDTLVGDNKYVVVFEVLQEQLTEGYRWVSLDTTDAGGSQLGVVIAICHEAVSKPAYGVAV